MHQAGVAESLWAIEKEDTAANAYRLNNPKTIMFSGDCNKLLQRVMNVNFFPSSHVLYLIYALSNILSLLLINIINKIDTSCNAFSL